MARWSDYFLITARARASQWARTRTIYYGIHRTVYEIYSSIPAIYIYVRMRVECVLGQACGARCVTTLLLKLEAQSNHCAISKSD